MAMKFDHVAVPSNDIARSVEWYHQHFAASVLYQDKTWAFLNIGGTKLALVSPQQHPPHVAIDVSEEELVAASKQTGVPIDNLYATEDREGGAMAIGDGVPGVEREMLSVFRPAEWEKEKTNLMFDLWAERARAAEKK